MNELVEKKRDFWNKRAKTASHAGSDDFMLKQIESNFILDNLPSNARVLDIGCGNGETLIKAAETHDVEGIGLDFSPEMIALAKKKSGRLSDKISFMTSDVRELPDDIGEFDVVYTQRCLINLNDTNEQKQAVEKILSKLKLGGCYIMVESTVDGQDKTNELRRDLGIEELTIPWHNHFFKISDVESWQTDQYKIELFDNISSTYHFLSRVVYASVGEPDGSQLRYDSKINKLALKLPPNIGEFGPVKAWIWRRQP